LRARLSSAGSAFVRSVLSPAAVGGKMRERLEALRDLDGHGVPGTPIGAPEGPGGFGALGS
jgi:hypothetical protein